jgi:hypothetical protein
MKILGSVVVEAMEKGEGTAGRHVLLNVYTMIWPGSKSDWAMYVCQDVM